jgi:hypothetical protein
VLCGGACSLFVSPPSSTVGQGLRFRSGNPEFDQFFADLHSLQISVAEAPDRERAIRAELASELGIKGGATVGVLVTEVRERTEQLQRSNVRTKLEVEGYTADDPLDVAATLRTSGGHLSGPSQRFAESVVRASRAELTFMANARRDARRLEKLLAVSALLEDAIDDAFRVGGPAKRAEVEKNLADARKLIPLMVVSARDVADRAQRVVRALQDAITTDRTIGSPAEAPLIVSEPEPAAVPVEPEPPPKTPPAHHSSPPVRRAPVKPSASPKPAKASDFEP